MGRLERTKDDECMDNEDGDRSEMVFKGEDQDPMLINRINNKHLFECERWSCPQSKEDSKGSDNCL